MSNPLSDVVSRQYEKWTYPEPIEDLEAWLTTSWQLMDPSHSHRLFWPDRDYQPDLDILIAGCGTNQAAVYAYNNRDAKVVGVDISESSLSHERYLKDKYGLANLELRQQPIEELPDLGLDFDLVVSSGVLHHMADPMAGVRALAACLRPNGAMGLMLYGKYGRIGVEIMQTVFRDLGLTQDDASLDLVKKILPWLPAYHPVRTYLSLADDLNFDAGLVDTFLHGRDRSYSVDDCLDLVESAGLVFQSWFLNSPYYFHPLADSASEIHAALEQRVPERTIWSLMERVRANNGTHNFIACRPDRPKEGYAIDFSTIESTDYVPLLRKGCSVADDSIVRPNWHLHLDAAQSAMARHIDGRRTVREIASMADPTGKRSKVEKSAREFFQRLWHMDFVAVAKP